MRKILLITVLALMSLQGFSPITRTITILHPPPINPYERLLRASIITESSGDSMAYNAEEGAAGILQIRMIRLKDYNQRTGYSYSLKDCYNTKISKQIYLYYASKFSPYDLESIARSWNGSGPQTDEYWRRVKSIL
jgi:hypothetical protein